MTQRPRLRTGRRVLDRGDGAVQLGVEDDALVLTGLPPGLVDCLRLLTGGTPLAEVQDTAVRSGVPLPALAALLDALVDAAVLDRGAHDGRAHDGATDEQVDALARHGLDSATARERLARAGAARVAVVGRGPLAQDVVSGLVDLGLDAHATEQAHAPQADVVVLVGRDVTDPVVAGQAVLTDRPVLPVVATAHGVTIGPWHDGPTGPCPQCLDLRRTDADPAWPTLLHQLCRTDGRAGPAPVDADPVVARLAAAVVAQWVRRHVVGLPEAPGLTCEVDAWDLGTTHRVWPVHPRCGRHGTASLADPLGSPASDQMAHAARRPVPAGGVTMAS